MFIYWFSMCFFWCSMHIWNTWHKPPLVIFKYLYWTVNSRKCLICTANNTWHPTKLQFNLLIELPNVTCFAWVIPQNKFSLYHTYYILLLVTFMLYWLNSIFTCLFISLSTTLIMSVHIMRSSTIKEALQSFLPSCTFSHPIVVNVKDVDLLVSVLL